MPEADIDNTPYDELDLAVRDLCRVINTNFFAIRTTSSCQGFIDGHREGEPWVVIVQPKESITEEAYAQLEFLAWTVSDIGKAGSKIEMTVHSMPPHLNIPGETMYFSISGQENNIADFTGFLEKVVSEYLSDRYSDR